MNLVRAAATRLLISIPREDLIGMSNALNEVCNGAGIEDVEFEARLGQTREDLRKSLRALVEALEAPVEASAEVLTVWADGSSIRVRAVSASGDPVDLGVEEARGFAAQILECAGEAEP